MHTEARNVISNGAFCFLRNKSYSTALAFPLPRASVSLKGALMALVGVQRIEPVPPRFPSHLSFHLFYLFGFYLIFCLEKSPCINAV